MVQKLQNLLFTHRYSISKKNKTHTLKAKAVQKKSGVLQAPGVGEMNRVIKESVDSTIDSGMFENSGKSIFYETATRAGL